MRRTASHDSTPGQTGYGTARTGVRAPVGDWRLAMSDLSAFSTFALTCDTRHSKLAFVLGIFFLLCVVGKMGRRVTCACFQARRDVICVPSASPLPKKCLPGSASRRPNFVSCRTPTRLLQEAPLKTTQCRGSMKLWTEQPISTRRQEEKPSTRSPLNRHYFSPPGSWRRRVAFCDDHVPLPAVWPCA